MRDPAAAFKVSEATIRQDPERLEAEGHLKCEYGGARLNARPAQPGAMVLHHQENMDRKRRIGALAASLVADGETLILDAGTTTEVATRLVERRDLTIITNALNVATILGAVPDNAVHIRGAVQGAHPAAVGRRGCGVVRAHLRGQAVPGHGRRGPGGGAHLTRASPTSRLSRR